MRPPSWEQTVDDRIAQLESLARLWRVGIGLVLVWLALLVVLLAVGS